MAIGQAGTVVTNSPTENAPITITLDQPLTDPVFALTATNNGGNQFVLRVTGQTLDANGDTTAFTFIIEEWEYHDGPHGATETINWLAVEEGVHTLPDGRIIEAGTTSATSGNSTVALEGGFIDPPVVLTSVMSENDTTTVDSDPWNITNSGFTVSLQEEEAEDDNHAAETVGYIAIQGGGDAESGTANTFGGFDEGTDTLSLGDTFTDAVVLGETQTMNGGYTATVVIDGQTNSTVDMFLEEEESQDTEVNHINETIGVVAFEDGLIPCFTAGTMIETDTGPQLVQFLKPGDMLRTYDGDFKPVKLVLQRRLTAADLAEHPNLMPIRIDAGALGSKLPNRTMHVSPQHRMLIASRLVARTFDVPEVLMAAKHLTALPGISVDDQTDGILYVHVIMEQHEVLIADGAPSESLLPAPEALRAMLPEARAEILSLFPEIGSDDYIPTPARSIPHRKQQRAFAEKLESKGKNLLKIH